MPAAVRVQECKRKAFLVICILSIAFCLFCQSKDFTSLMNDEEKNSEKTVFPGFLIANSEQTTAGYYVFAISPYLSILDHWGNPMFYREVSGGVRNFTPQVNGLFSYYDISSGSFHLLNQRFQVIDTFTMKSGYNTDMHEFILLEDGSSILMSRDPRQVDMSAIFPGGSPNATVAGVVFQELNPSGEVVFQWESWDHFDILDCDTHFVDLTAKVIDYVHANALTIDTDGHLLLSCRHMSEITKINRTTGEIIWRLGGKKNEFQFIDDVDGFSGQHSPTRLANGNLLIFDNGNSHIPQISSAKEYRVDEENKTARLIREHRQSPDVYTSVMGNSVPIPNNHILVGWGKNSSGAFLTEFDEEGNVCTAVSCPNSSSLWSYRVSFIEKFTALFPADTHSLDFGTIALGDALIKTIDLTNDSGSSATLVGISAADNPFYVLNSLPVQMHDGDSVQLKISFRPDDVGTFACPVYLTFRFDSLMTEDHLVASRLFLSGKSAFHGSDIRNQMKSNVTIYPNPFQDDLFLDNCEAVNGIALFTITGVKMIHMDVNRKSRLHIGTDPLLPGLYILELRYREGYAEKRVIIKTN
jgi:hypothetical protein